jgi:hypothetical protein
MRSSVSAGGIGRPHAPGGVISGPRFGHFRGSNRYGGTVVYPYGFYDGFYGGGYETELEQPTPVVVVHDERPVPPPAPSLPAPDPKIIDVPQSLIQSKTPSAPVAAIFILTDGRKLESQNYTVTDKLLTIKQPHQPGMQIPLAQINVDATLSANHARGVDLKLPESRSEILIGF